MGGLLQGAKALCAPWALTVHTQRSGTPFRRALKVSRARGMCRAMVARRVVSDRSDRGKN